MAMDPEDIERAVFKERFRGYDQDQVDRFLDQVSAGLSALRGERDALAAEVESLRSGGYPPPAVSGEGAPDALISRTLSAAQRTADEVVAEARRQAAEVLEDARGRAERDRSQVRAEADLVRRAVGELKSFRDEYRARLHAIMTEQLAALDRAGELPRLPAVVEQLGDAPAVSVVAASPPAPRREPSPAQAWAAAAAQDDDETEQPPADDFAEDGLASPWDDLWRGEEAAAQVQAPVAEGTQDPRGAGFPQAAPPVEPRPEHAGDA